MTWAGMPDRPVQPAPQRSLQTVSDVRDAVRRRRQSVLAALQSSIRQLEQEPLWATTSCLELAELKASMLTARDELARRIDGKEQRLLDREEGRVRGLHNTTTKSGRLLQAAVEQEAAANAEALEAQLQRPAWLQPAWPRAQVVGSRTHGEGFDVPQP